MLSIKQSACLLLLALTPASRSGAQTQPTHKPILPLQPAELIKLLPSAPKGWEMKQSIANSFYNEWLVSQASRQFVGPPTSKTSSTPALLPTTRVRLTDTGYSPTLFADFQAFKPGKYANTENLYFNSLPARRISLSNGERLRILVKERFVIEVETHNQLPNSAVSWAGLLDLSRLTSTPDSGIDKLPKPVTVVSIDELNPKANSSYQVNWSTEDDMDAARRRKP
jgi:hypothetical protein